MSYFFFYIKVKNVEIGNKLSIQWIMNKKDQ